MFSARKQDTDGWPTCSCPWPHHHPPSELGPWNISWTHTQNLSVQRYGNKSLLSNLDLILFHWLQETTRVTYSKTHIEGPGHGLHNSICVPHPVRHLLCACVTIMETRVSVITVGILCACVLMQRRRPLPKHKSPTLRVSCLHLTPCLQASPHDSGHLSTKCPVSSWPTSPRPLLHLWVTL